MRLWGRDLRRKRSDSVAVTGRSAQEGLQKAGGLKGMCSSNIRVMSLENEGLGYEGKNWVGLK